MPTPSTRTRRRNEPRGPITWQEWYAGHTRSVNQLPPTVFKPNVKLEPSQVRDIRAPQPEPSFVQSAIVSTYRNLKSMLFAAGKAVGGRDVYREGVERLKEFK